MADRNVCPTGRTARTIKRLAGTGGNLAGIEGAFMDPVRKAIWYVESHSREEISLDDIAAACHVSAFHLTRAFATTTGLSLMRYVRARRLSEAAKRLADGAADILRVALDAGYGSHEAFTRAFRDHFGLTPEQARARRDLTHLPLTEALAMKTTPEIQLPSPRFETIKPLSLVGMTEHYSCQSAAGIPDQWQKFSPRLGTIPGQVGKVAYGVCYNVDRDDNFDYLCGVEVASSAELPHGLTRLQVPAQKYAVFTHRGHVSEIRAVFSAVWSKWLPQSGYEAASAPVLERYGPEFNGENGLGGFEVWVPIKG
jgi:AraC family transcriptional regulator